MAKNANAKAWALQIGELNRRWSDQPFDLTGPSAPTITAFGSPTEITIGVKVTVDAVDARTGIRDYVIELAQSSIGPFDVAATVSVGQAQAGFNLPGLTPSTQYFVRLRGRDGSQSGNIGEVSNTISQTTLAAQVVTGYWPNWPSMNGAAHQGNSSFHILDPTRFAELADKDAVIFQSFYPTVSRKTSRRDNLASIRALNPGNRVKFHMYWIPQEVIKNMPATLTNDPHEIHKALIDDAVKGNPAWIAHRVGSPGAAGRVECNFDPTTRWNCNMAVLVSGNNSLSQNYAFAFNKEWYDALDAAPSFISSMDGVFQDNFCCRPPNMYQNNGAVTVTDQDYNGNGVADGRSDYSAGANAGGRFWAEGHLEFKAQFEAKFGPNAVMIPNAARWYSDYTDGLGSPPKPISLHPYYRKWELTFQESVNLFLGLAKSATAYSFNGGGSFSSFFRMYNVQERMLLPDAQNTRTGKSGVMMQALCVDRATPTSADFAYARFVSASCLLVERAVMCCMQSAARPLSLDETLLELGNPIGARTMGTLNETTITFSQRTANFSSGVARFYWAIFQKGMVLVRGDSPTIGAYPSADAAVACTLPAPPSGMKWQRINPTYKNPKTNRTMRNQDPAVNTGLDCGATISLKPYHAIFLRAVPV
jgi:hypothetical protein